MKGQAPEWAAAAFQARALLIALNVCMSVVKEMQEGKMTPQERFPTQPLTGALWGKALLPAHLPGNVQLRIF